MVLALLMCKTTAFLPPNNSFSPPSPTSLTERSNTRTSLSMTAQQSYNKVFLAGASRGVGNCLLKTLVAEGIHVVALVRSPEVLETLNAIEGVTAIQGDAFDYKSVESAMDGCDAAISTLGGSMSKEEDGDKPPTKVDYTGNSNVIEAAGILGVTRLVLVTSIGCGTSKEAAPPAVFDVLAPTLEAKEKAENLLLKYYTNMNWTIIRPGGLKSEAATGQAVLSDDCLAIGSIHRQDCADLVAKALTSPKTERQVLSAIDPSIITAVNPDARPITEFALS